MSKTYESVGAAKRYDSARELPRETVDHWMQELRGLLPAMHVRRILDLGCGTGRFVSLLKGSFQCAVVGVDPSTEMLEQARARDLQNVEWKTASAKSLPLADNMVDLVWMSQVFHHLENPQIALREIERVLTSMGCLAIRNGTRENDREIEWSHCFPEAQQIDDGRLPSQEDLVRFVCDHGFEVLAVKTVYQLFASSYAEYYDKISQRGLSSLISISDEAFNAGLERLKQWVVSQPTGQPVFEPVDLFVFRIVKHGEEQLGATMPGLEKT